MLVYLYIYMNNMKKTCNILNSDDFSQIEKMIDSYKKHKNQELEASLQNISYTSYIRISEYYINSIHQDNISMLDSLDISINLADNNFYRISILEAENIDSFINKTKNYDPLEFLKYLLSIDNDNDHNIIFKNRGNSNRVYIKDFDTVIKLTQEIPVKSKKDKPSLKGTEKIWYRYKNRYSFIINDNIKIDITNVRESIHLLKCFNAPVKYEIEMEVTGTKITAKLFEKSLCDLLKIYQNSQVPIGHQESSNVLESYKKTLNLKYLNTLETRNVITLEQHHIVNFIPNKYAVTEKADGERHILFIHNGHVYLITTNLTVKKLKLKILNEHFYDTILDGELINNNSKAIFLVFDVIYYNKEDYRYNDNFTLIHRINVMNKIIEKCFDNFIPFTDYTEKHSDIEQSKIKNFYSKEIVNYWNIITEKIKITKNVFIIGKKYFVPYGIDSSEIFMYADILWKTLIYKKIIPYNIDGIIYTPINSPYLIKATPKTFDTKPLEYKWKIPSQNSIDFYIIFNKDQNNNDAIYYDKNVIEESGKPYKICKLYVSRTVGNEEKPVPFIINNTEQTAYIYLSDNEARDLEGKIINSKSVVEFIYDLSQTNIEDSFKWLPLRTRYDKTEYVKKFNKKYGNNLAIAKRNWNTIINPISEDIIAALGNPKTFQIEIDHISKGLTNLNSSNIYYQKKSLTGIGMRAFNNWIKSNMIITYCNNKKRILDIGCGRGGDLQKFIRAGVSEYVGFDIDNNGLYEINDSAYNRYLNLKKKNKHVPPMYFINADAKSLLTYEHQQNIFPNMTQKNRKMLEDHLESGKKYDVINCQFSLHYYLSDKLSWNNFCENINNHIEDNGYLLITCFDGDLIYNKLHNNKKIKVSYTDKFGAEKIFFEIIKAYPDNIDDKIGLGIDLYNSTISNPGTYIREFLVFPDFLKKSLEEKCSLKLVESESFFNLFNLYRKYFTQNTNDDDFLAVSANLPTKQYDIIRNFYLSLYGNNSDITINREEILSSFKFTILNRYYIFKKNTKLNFNQSRIISFGYNLSLGKILVPYLLNNKLIIDPNKKDSDINKIYSAIRNKYSGIKPSVYLIRHHIVDHTIDDLIFTKNKMDIIRAKKGLDPKTLLIYKSPDKKFYPIYYRENDGINLDDINHLYTNNNFLSTDNEQSGSYLLDSSKVIKDLDIIVKLTNMLT